MRSFSILVLIAGCGGSSTCSLVGTWTGTDSLGLPLTVGFVADGTLEWSEGGIVTTGNWHGTLVTWGDNGDGGEVKFDRGCRTLSLGTTGQLLTRVSDTPLDGVTCVSEGSSGCSCTMGPQASPTPASCDNSLAPESICCATSGWPSKIGAECDCASLLCWTFGPGSSTVCTCDWGIARTDGVEPESACSGASFCCLTDDGSSCTCYSWSPMDCTQFGQHQVPSCESQDFPPTCGEGNALDSCGN